MFQILSYTLLTVLTVDLLASSGDQHMTWTSPVFAKLKSNDSSVNPLGKPLDDEAESWIGSLINIGAVIGPLPYSFMAEYFGRKTALLCVGVHHITAYLILAFSKSVTAFCLGRLWAGFAVGAGYTLLPMYVAEVAEDSNRGMLSVTLNIFWTFGNFLPYAVGPYVPIMWLNIILGCTPAAFFALFLIVAPETPYYLVKENQMEKATKSLKLLRRRNEGEIKKEIEHIKSVLEHDEHGRLSDIFKKKIYIKALAISLILIIAQQLAGINAVLFYTQEIFEAAGVTSISPEISSIIIGLILFASSFTTPFFADSAGRKPLLLISNMGMVVSFAALGAFFYLNDNTKVNVGPISWLPIVSFILYIITFNIAVGPLPWTVSSELFPANVKPVAAGLTSSICWLTSFIVTKFFIDLTNSIGKAGTFWLFGGFCLAAFVFTLMFVPETKGKSFSEIQEILK